MRIKLKSVKWGLVVFCGWPVILFAAAITLSDPRRPSAIATMILLLMGLWLVLSMVALSVYFYRGWRRINIVPNKAAYIAWMSMETALALAILAGIVLFFALPS
jgi:hypothetical protein